MPPRAPHGVYSSYTGGCRCEECKKANNLYKKERRDFKRETESTKNKASESLEEKNVGVFWHPDAACRGSDVNKFFPESDDGTNFDYRPALVVCANCKAQQECFQYAMETKQKYGVWGMSTPSQRRRWRANQPGSAPSEPHVGFLREADSLSGKATE